VEEEVEEEESESEAWSSSEEEREEYKGWREGGLLVRGVREKKEEVVLAKVEEGGAEEGREEGC